MLSEGGSLTDHMAVHIGAMNVVAPVAALVLRRRAVVLAGARWPLAAAVTQVALIAIWHLPSMLALAMHQPAAMAAMHLSLFLAALWFWHAALAAADGEAWRSLLALLVTGKVFCLVGALLVLAPAPLYAAAFASHGEGPAAGLLADQQTAGLLMLVACPMTYVLAGIVVTARWLSRVDRAQEWPGPARPA
ncbi:MULTISPECIES: cytochrome c oxidase assembly protein [unclassified Chelatococcus]|uniref:cytochrome c oxidase assembly protein n=1 Tax=unclassified Chelatococcus TaxID=2638111 RepID=UPI0002E150CE|nr:MULTISPECIES: cytochrome c oxidase assembly protein [unclassified Chelatococcus]ALA19178.1 hypothetical protein AL346_19375 [Chelatococcus sp. CO-6]